MKRNEELRISSPGSLPGLGLSICPGKVDPFAYSGPCARDLKEDVAAIRRWGADIVVTLMEKWELERLHVAALGQEVEKAGMEWHFWEVMDGSPLELAGHSPCPDPFAAECAYLLSALNAGKKVFVHCRGGLGRTGTLAARLLIANGSPPEEAIREVRAARKGAIETIDQEEYLLNQSWK